MANKTETKFDTDNSLLGGIQGKQIPYKHLRDPKMIDLDLMIQQNNGRRTANMKTRNQKLFGTTRDTVQVKDYCMSGLINDNNMQRPEHGMKNYAI